MAELKSTTVLKYMVSIRKVLIYLELITEICRYVQAKKTSDLEAHKLI